METCNNGRKCNNDVILKYGELMAGLWIMYDKFEISVFQSFFLSLCEHKMCITF